MFVATIRFPAVPEERVQPFLDWFTWSNDVLRGTAGLRQRRLLRGTGDSFAALVEHESAETFAQMHRSEEATRIQARLATILDERPQAATFEVAAELVPDGSHCCDSTGGEPPVTPLDRAPSATTPPSPSGCCA